MTRRILGVLALAFACAGTASGHDRSARSTAAPTAGSPHKQSMTEAEQPFLANDKLFLWRVHWINQTEEQAGELAKSRSKTAGVTTYGNRLASDHSRNEQRLLTLAKKKNIKMQLTREEYQKVRDVLARQMTAQMDLVHEEEENFDEEFLTHMADDHVAAIDLLRSYRLKVKDADVRAFIDETLPMLQEHHEMAVALLESGQRHDVKGIDKGSPSTQPREEPQDKPEEGVDRQRSLEEGAKKRTEPPPHEEQRVPPR